MKTVYYFLCFLFIGIAARLGTQAQCVPALTATPACSVPTLLKAEMNKAIQYLEWTRAGGGGVLRRDTAVHVKSGTTTAGTTGVSGTALNLLNGPSALAIYNDTLYVVEQAGARIMKWGPGATQGIVVAGGNGVGAALNQLDNPIAVHVGAGDTVYVLELINNRITKWGPGATQGIIAAGGNGAGNALNQLNLPHGFYVHPDGSIYVAEYTGGRIKKFPAGSTQSTNGTLVVNITQPMSIGMDPLGNMYVGTASRAVYKYPTGSTTPTTVATNTGRPRGMFVDKNGNVWVVEDADNHRIVQYVGGTSTVKVIAGGTLGSAATQFEWPGGLVIDEVNGVLYVADYGNNRVQKFTASIRDTLTASVADQYTIQAKGFSGCAASASVTTANSGPTVTPGSNPSVCLGATSAALPYTATGSPDRYEITWNTAALTAGFGNVTGQTLPNASAGTISITVPGAAAANTYNGSLTVRNSTTGCVSATQNISVTVSTGVSVTPGTNPSVCAGTTTASLPYSGATGSPNQYSIAWNTAAQTAGFVNATNQSLPSGTISITVPGAAAPATYSGSLTVRNSSANCVSTSYNISVTVSGGVLLVPGTNPSVCAGATTASLPYTGAAGSPNQYSISWNTAAQTAGFINATNQSLPSGAITLAVPGSAAPAAYNGTMTVRNSTIGCTSTSYNISITIHARPAATIQTAGPVNLCAGNDTLLTAGAGTGYGYVWKNSQGVVGSGGNYTAAATGSYYVVVTNANNCTDSSTPVSITMYALPRVSIVPGDTAFCDGGLVRLEAVSPDTGIGYQWKDGNTLLPATADFIEVSVSGAYSVVAHHIMLSGCTDSTQPVQVTVHPLPAAPISWDGITLHTDTGYVSYQWYDGIQPISGATKAHFKPYVSGSYNVAVTDSNGCSNASLFYNFTLGVVDVAANEIKVYPNPAQTVINIQSTTAVRAIIGSMDGRQVLRYEGIHIAADIASLPDGTYIVRITDQEDRLIRNEKITKYAK